MAGRYLITGVQLGMLVALPNQEDRQKLISDIEDKQFLCNSDIEIGVDCYRVTKMLNTRDTQD